MGRVIIVVSILLLFCNYDSFCQVCEKVQVDSKEGLDIQLRTAISKDFIVDTTSNVTIIFVLKVDSLGEIHSAHVRYAKNFRWEKYLTISRFLESCIRAPFIFRNFRNEFTEKYVWVDFPYSAR